MTLQELHRGEGPIQPLKRVPSKEEMELRSEYAEHLGDRLAALMEELLAQPRVPAPEECLEPAAIIVQGNCAVQTRNGFHHTLGRHYGYLVAFEPAVGRSRSYVHEPSVYDRILFMRNQASHEQILARELPAEDWCRVLAREELFWPRGDEMAFAVEGLRDTLSLVLFCAPPKRPFYAHLQEISLVPAAEAKQLYELATHYAYARSETRAMRYTRNKHLRD